MKLPTLRGEDGNTLILMPFAVLVLLAMGGLALDAAVAFRAQRHAVDVATAMADDVAARIDPVAFATDGVVTIDAVAATAVADDTARRLAQDPGCDAGGDRSAGVPCLVCTLDLGLTGTSVDVTCEGDVRPLILPAIGDLATIDIGATVTARAVQVD